MELQLLIALLTLVALEIVLGIDNIIFISILTGKLPKEEHNKARLLGLALAMITRIGLLFSLTLLMRLTFPLFTIAHHEISGKDIILIIGGLFLIAKSTHEIHEKLEGDEEGSSPAAAKAKFAAVIAQIVLIDIVFSLDSVITAVGMTNELFIMVLAIVIAVIFMMFFSGRISAFVNDRPTIKMLALSFLLLIGFTLVLEGFDQHVPKGYLYFGMAFSLFTETLNLKSAKKRRSRPVELRSRFKPAAGEIN